MHGTLRETQPPGLARLGALSTSGSERMSIVSQPIEVFCAYDEKDEELCKRLEQHLSLMMTQRLISLWYNRKVAAGEDRMKTINEHLKNARIILLLVSP